MNTKFMGEKALIEALRRASGLDLEDIQAKNIAQMYNRSRTDNPLVGGTPFDTGELRLSVNVDIGNYEIGYIKEYAPHVEYGHATPNGGFVQGQKFLKHNVEIQKPIFIADLKAALAKVI